MSNTTLEEEIREYPTLVRLATLRLEHLDSEVVQLNEEIDALQEGPDPESDAKLLKLNKQMEKLKQQKHAAMLRDPKAFGLTASSLTKNKIEVVLSADEQVIDIQEAIDARCAELLEQTGEEAHAQAIEERQERLALLEEEQTSARIERDILMHAHRDMLGWLVQLAAAK